MFRRRAHRLTTMALVVLALLFSQLALANYVCPVPDPAPAGSAPMAMAPGQPCEGGGMGTGLAVDPEQPVLCHQHCANAPQSFDLPQVPVVSLPAVVQVLVVRSVQAGATEAAVFARAGEARPPPDPLFLATLRLRV